jgi:hypothetical protein
MSVAIHERTQFTVEAAKAELRRRFEIRLDSASESVVLKAVALPDEKAFTAVSKVDSDKKLSIETRNQKAVANMRARAFERVSSRCELLTAQESHDILGISKQALSQKTKAGLVLAYTNTSNRRKYYPSFQFSENKTKPVIAKLINELKIDPVNTEAMNFLVQHLVSKMDFSSPGEPENVLPRYELLDNSAAVEIIKRDFINAFEPGQ